MRASDRMHLVRGLLKEYQYNTHSLMLPEDAWANYLECANRALNNTHSLW